MAKPRLQNRFLCILSLFKSDEYKSLTFLEALDFCEFIENQPIEELYDQARMFLQCYNKAALDAKEAEILCADDIAGVRKILGAKNTHTITLVKQNTIERFICSVNVKKLANFDMSRSKFSLKNYAELLVAIGNHSSLFIDNFSLYGQTFLDIIQTFDLAKRE